MHAYNEGVEFQFQFAVECFARASHCKSIKAEVVNLTSETRPRYDSAQATL